MHALSSKHVSCMESNKVKVVAILEALLIFTSSFHSKLVVESGSLNDISWVSSHALPPWRLQLFLNENKVLSSSVLVEFQLLGDHLMASPIQWLSKGWINSLCSLCFPCSFGCSLFVVSFLFGVG